MVRTLLVSPHGWLFVPFTHVHRWSPILLAVRNPNTGTFEAVCKCMSGFTDRYYAEMKEFYNDDESEENSINTSKSKKAYYETSLHPAIWFEPKEVWEIAFADITLSPTYTAAMGLVSEERGLSLRFPRFLRKRDDKGINEASTPQFLAGMFYPLIPLSAVWGLTNECRSLF